MEPEVKTTEEEALTPEQLDKLVNVVNSEALKKDMLEQQAAINDQATQLLNTVNCLPNDKDMITERLKNYTVDELEKYLKSDNNVQSFFTDDDGNVYEMAISFDSVEKEIEFKRGLLVYLKTSDETMAKIDEEYEKLDAATSEINEEIQDVCYQLSDNILTYIAYEEDKAAQLTDENAKKQVLEALRYVKSGYTLEVFSESYDAYPSTIKNCKSDMLSENRVASIGKRYLSKLHTAKSKVSLLPFISEDGEKSLEETVLLEENYTIPNLFVFSLIRYFSMQDWNNPNIRRAHATVSLVIKRLMTGDFEEDVKTNVVDAIVEYLKKFN